MRNRGTIHSTAGLLAALSLAFTGLWLTGCEEAEELLTDTYMVRLGAEPQEVATVVNDLQLEFADIFEFEPMHMFTEVTQGFSVQLPIGVAESFEGLTDIDYIIIDPPKNYEPPEGSDPEFPAGEIPEGVARIGGPTVVTLGGVEVAVVDTGIDLDHPELEASIVGTYDAIGEGGGSDNDGDDGNGHGTHVAGTIGALFDDNGVIGVAPGVGLHAVRVLDNDGSGTIGDIVAGLEYVAKNPDIKVVNMSLGGPSDPSSGPQPLEEAIQALEDMGVVVCIAAGNDGTNTNGYIPAGYDLGVVVSAYDAYGGVDNGFAEFSNFGDEVDVAAPGVNITSTWNNGDYASISGTSMATPHVAGAMAAYFAVNPDASAEEARQAVISTGEDNYSGQGGDHPEPMVDVTELAQ